MQEQSEEQSAEEMQNVVFGLFTITLMLTGAYEAVSLVWGLLF